MDDCKPLLWGSSDLYHINKRKPYHSLNFITAHDGFSLRGRGVHLSTFQLNLSRFLSLTPPTDTEYPTKRAYVEPKSGRV